SADITALRRIGNAFLNSLTNLLFRTSFTDLCYGYNAFRRACLDVFDLPDPYEQGPTRWGDGFEIETMLNIRVAKARLAVTEIPSFERPRGFGQSHLRTFRDGGRVLLTILRERRTRSQHASIRSQRAPRSSATRVGLLRRSWRLLLLRLHHPGRSAPRRM
ncbi:MAG: hypothetical protein JXA67_05970, partial [Micromonosporaceae bacterium]|nr:hypothetical protein [Micromonosporaceae bacterium]